MQSFISFGQKRFKVITNFIFAFAILTILSQTIEGGLSVERLQHFNFVFKLLNVLFSLLCVLMSYFLYLNSSVKLIRISRMVFLLTSLFYFVISILWAFSFSNVHFDVEPFRLFLAPLIGFIAVSFKISSLGNSSIHPSLLFVLSFIFLIIFGTFCLMLPAAAYTKVSVLDALFTATSAVTVTGLAVMDTGKDFTLFGQTIILILIQLGGLGVLTITNIFALVFQSSTSFRNRMMVSDMIKELDNKNTFSTLFKIIFLTIIVEVIGAILIYISIYSDSKMAADPVFFSVFHSVSAFCNGGFSTLSNSLFEESTRYNYSLQLIISWLIISGGIGYSVMINHYALLKNMLLNKLSKIKYLHIQYQKELVRTSTNSRIIIITSGILLLAGTLLFYISEYQGTLKEHSFFGKIVVSFFNSTTARTAGFNNIDMASMQIPAFMLILALMWIGASPGSTGGGIKTTTFAVAILNLWNQIRGKDVLVVNYKEIPTSAINQVSAVILLSVFAISFSTFLLAFIETGIPFKDLLFECVSAYSTVGLSVGITGQLTDHSRIVIIFLMFLGRVSFLTFLIGIFGRIFNSEKTGCEPSYPKESVYIN